MAGEQTVSTQKKMAPSPTCWMWQYINMSIGALHVFLAIVVLGTSPPSATATAKHPPIGEEGEVHAEGEIYLFFFPVAPSRPNNSSHLCTSRELLPFKHKYGCNRSRRRSQACKKSHKNVPLCMVIREK